MNTPRLFVCLIGLLLGACAAVNDLPPENTPDDAAEANFKLGILYMKSGRYHQAQFKLKRALEFNPEMSTAYNALGVLYEQLDNQALAIEHYRSALEKAPDYTLARLNLGRLLCRNDETVQGEQEFLAVAASPGYATPEIPFTGAGVCARNRNDLATAEAHFRKALEDNPTASQTLLELAAVTTQQKKYTDARDVLKRYHAQSDYNTASLNLAIRIEDALGNKKASKQFRALLQQRNKT